MPGNKWSRLQEATSSIGEALMQITALTESRRYRAAMLDRGTRADELALARIERDNELLVQNRVQQEATWQDQGWTGTPGTQVWTPGQLPVDTGEEQPDLGGLFDRPPTGMGPMGQASMGEMGVDVEPGAMGGMGATYPGPSPISMGGDPSQFGAELMQVPQLGGDYVPGSFEDASYDPSRGTAYQDQVALNELEAQKPPTPTYGVSGGTPSVTGLGTEDEATAFASRNAPTEAGARFGIDPATGRMTVSGATTFEEIQEILSMTTPPPGLAVDAAASLRAEFSSDPIVNDAQKVMTAYAKLREVALAEPTGPNDLSILFSFMKMLDPGSVVRESEFANAQNAQGVPELVRSQFNRVQAGERLTVDSRAKFLQSAESLMEGQRKALEPVVERYRGLAERGGHTFENVGYDPLEGAGTGTGPIVRLRDRIDELIAAGVEDDEIERILRDEGYYGPGGAG